jgi:hypothetical protein
MFVVEGLIKSSLEMHRNIVATIIKDTNSEFVKAMARTCQRSLQTLHN